MQTIKAFSNEAAMLCAGTFALLLVTAISNYLRLDLNTGKVPFGEYIGEFMLPAIPLALSLLLLALRSQAAATIVASLGSLFYLFTWATLTI